MCGFLQRKRALGFLAVKSTNVQAIAARVTEQQPQPQPTTTTITTQPTNQPTNQLTTSHSIATRIRGHINNSNQSHHGRNTGEWTDHPPPQRASFGRR
jgi:hypothetical protein